MTEAMDLLGAGMCSPRCLLAMETPPGWVGCQCVCDGRYHAALIDHEVREIRRISDADGADLGVRPAVGQMARAS